MRTLTFLCLAAIFMPFVARSTVKETPYFVEVSGRSLSLGYWHNWCDNTIEYSGARPKCMQLNEVPNHYNIVSVAYMKSLTEGEIPTFEVDVKTGVPNAVVFRNQVLQLAEHRTPVIISVGGPESKILLQRKQVDELVNEFKRIFVDYGFSGVDINLEHSVMVNSDNAHVIVQATRIVKVFYQVKSRRQPVRQYIYIHLSEQVSFRCEENAPFRRLYRGQLYNFWDFMTVKFYGFDEQDEDFLQGLLYPSRIKKVGYFTPELNPEQIKTVYDKLQTCEHIRNVKILHGTSVTEYVSGFKSPVTANIISFFNGMDSKSKYRGIASWSINWAYGQYTNGTQFPPFVQDLVYGIPQFNMQRPDATE